jgi:hypothetical protein
MPRLAEFHEHAVAADLVELVERDQRRAFVLGRDARFPAPGRATARGG